MALIRLVLVGLFQELPYNVKCWQWETLANSTEDYIGEKALVNSNEKQCTLSICIADVELSSILDMLDIFSITPYIITISGKLIE